MISKCNMPPTGCHVGRPFNRIALHTIILKLTVLLKRLQDTLNCIRNPELSGYHGTKFCHTMQECASFHQNHTLEQTESLMLKNFNIISQRNFTRATTKRILVY